MTVKIVLTVRVEIERAVRCFLTLGPIFQIHVLQPGGHPVVQAHRDEDEIREARNYQRTSRYTFLEPLRD